MPSRIRIKNKTLNRLRTGHLWVYSEEIENPRPEMDGTIVALESDSGEFVGQGFFNSRSRIAFRLLGKSPEAIGREFFRDRIQLAGQKREGRIGPEQAVRLINAEGDLLPGLIADWYAGRIVIQCLIPGTDRLKEMIADILQEEFQPEAIWFRNDSGGRGMEGLPEEVFLWKGNADPRVVFREGQVRFEVDLKEGHKTGAYLDQAENHLRAGELSRGRCLDAFTFQGGFALHLAAKAEQVMAVDSSAPALSVLEKNLELNGIKNVKPVKRNIFELLPELERAGEKFDLIALDPPSFAKSKKDLHSARRGYAEINRRAVSLLCPSGILLSYSCSYNFSLSELLEAARWALADSGRTGRLLEIQTQAGDHPVLLNMPETWYLKGLVLEVN